MSETLNLQPPSTAELQPAGLDVEHMALVGQATQSAQTLEVTGQPNPEAVQAFAFQEVAEEVGDTAVESVVEEPRSSEQDHGQEQRESAIKERIKEAVVSCEFDTLHNPEVREALEGFYEDHYGLVHTIEDAIEGKIDGEAADEILASEKGTLEAAKLKEKIEVMDEYGRAAETPSAADMQKLVAAAVKQDIEDGVSTQPSPRVLKAVASALPALFAESSVGISTVGDAEKEAIRNLREKVATAAVEQGGAKQAEGSDVVHWMQGNREGIRIISGDSLISWGLEEAQKEFWEDTRHAGQLEFHNTGNMSGPNMKGLMPRTEQYRQTGEMYVQMRADEKMHSVVPHFSEKYDPTGYKNGQKERAGTIALPLAEVLAVAPFARDAEYGVVQVRDEATLEKVPLVSGIHEIGFGADDTPGASGTDRVFFASERQDGEVMPDEYVLPTDRRATYIFNGEDERGASQGYGLGEGFPGRLLVDGEGDATTRVAQLQHESLKKYEGWVAVPLRRGVFTYRPENMPVNEGKGRPDPVYNRNPLLAA